MTDPHLTAALLDRPLSANDVGHRFSYAEGMHSEIPRPSLLRLYGAEWLRETYGRDLRRLRRETPWQIYRLDAETGKAKRLDRRAMRDPLLDALMRDTEGHTDPMTIGGGLRLYLTAERVWIRGRHGDRLRTREDMRAYATGVLRAAWHGLEVISPDLIASPESTRPEPAPPEIRRERQRDALRRHRERVRDGHARYATEWLEDVALDFCDPESDDRLDAQTLYDEYVAEFEQARDAGQGDFLACFASDTSMRKEEWRIDKPGRRLFYGVLEEWLAAQTGASAESVSACWTRRGKAKRRHYELAEIRRRAIADQRAERQRVYERTSRAM